MRVFMNRQTITKIINVANELLQAGSSTAASTTEHIAAAFVVNRMDLLPEGYEHVVEAWRRLDRWQHLVNHIRNDEIHRIHWPDIDVLNP
ncbi:MAG: hypothetical protein AAGB12_02725 [Pseudomonadota bacterium]